MSASAVPSTTRDGPPPPTRVAGLERLAAFTETGLRAYANSRNADLGPENRGNVSGLSPFIRHRLVLEDEVLRAVLDRMPLEAREKFVQEVFWRSYFKGWLEHHPAVWFAYRQSVQRLKVSLADDPELANRYQRAISGETGIACVDAWARELVAEGYLHNHARMWFASIWLFTLKLPWELGADFFMQHLLDGDAASNTLGWRWVAGLHTRGKTYLARPDNIRKYTGGRFNPPAGSLASSAVSLEEPELPPCVDIAPGDTFPHVGRIGLLVTDDDCVPELLDLPRKPVAAIGLSSAGNRSAFGVSELVRQFSEGAIADALQRVSSSIGCETEASAEDDWELTLADWASRHRLSAVVCAATCQGPAHDLLALAEQRLAADGITLIRLRRDFDLAAWPHATRGFFKLRKQIPQIIRTCQLG